MDDTSPDIYTVRLNHGHRLRLDREPGSSLRYTVGLWAGVGLAGAMSAADAADPSNRFDGMQHLQKIVEHHGIPR